MIGASSEPLRGVRSQLYTEVYKDLPMRGRDRKRRLRKESEKRTTLKMEIKSQKLGDNILRKKESTQTTTKR